ncbi:MAG: hypothetical protein QOC89_1095, partial [Paraburkholderia sp.]|nr:hypothetical protein [Paraburkholderia sp.]
MRTGAQCQAQTPPATLVGKGKNARQRSLRDDHEIETWDDVLRGALELVKQRCA